MGNYLVLNSVQMKECCLALNLACWLVRIKEHYYALKLVNYLARKKENYLTSNLARMTCQRNISLFYLFLIWIIVVCCIVILVGWCYRNTIKTTIGRNIVIFAGWYMTVGTITLLYLLLLLLLYLLDIFLWYDGNNTVTLPFDTIVHICLVVAYVSSQCFQCHMVQRDKCDLEPVIVFLPITETQCCCRRILCEKEMVLFDCFSYES